MLYLNKIIMSNKSKPKKRIGFSLDFQDNVSSEIFNEIKAKKSESLFESNFKNQSILYYPGLNYVHSFTKMNHDNRYLNKLRKLRLKPDAFISRSLENVYPKRVRNKKHFTYSEYPFHTINASDKRSNYDIKQFNKIKSVQEENRKVRTQLKFFPQTKFSNYISSEFKINPSILKRNRTKYQGVIAYLNLMDLF